MSALYEEKTATVPVLSVQGLSHVFQRQTGVFGQSAFHVLHNINFSLYPGKTLGLVGESGCGKSTLARIASGLMSPFEGVVRINGESLYNPRSHENFKQFRRDVCRTVQMVFQDPQSSLNPRMRVGDSVAEPLVCQEKNMPAAQRQELVNEMLLQVGIEPQQNASRYPHEFSGGQRQRIAIARALVLRPQVVICDEPTSSLDSSIQAQVLNVLTDMQERLSLAYLFISHDLSVIRYMSDDVAVMYAGNIVEYGPTEAVFSSPKHPYTQLLLASSMSVGKYTGKAAFAQKQEKESMLSEKREIQSHSSCPFFLRCPLSVFRCGKVYPPMMRAGVVGDKEHLVRCPVAIQNNAVTQEAI